MQRRYRWRTLIRRNLPWFLYDRGVAGKGKSDCGDHEWYKSDDLVQHCYHCPAERLAKAYDQEG